MKILQPSKPRILISLLVLLFLWLLPLTFGGCQESNPPRCPNAFAELFYNNQAMKSAYGLAVLAVAAYVVILIAIFLYRKMEK